MVDARVGAQIDLDVGAKSANIGQSVRVISWLEDGIARVHYRGTEWDAELESSSVPRDGVLYIKAIQGSKLILTRYKLHQQLD